MRSIIYFFNCVIVADVVVVLLIIVVVLLSLCGTTDAELISTLLKSPDLSVSVKIGEGQNIAYFSTLRLLPTILPRGVTPAHPFYVELCVFFPLTSSLNVK